MERSYRQYCAVAKALDVIGERWTLLIIRELLLGPRRYKDLLAGLPGIGTNLLAARLRKLEQAGLAHRRVLPAPAGSTAYELTELGRGLQAAVLELGRWGAHLLAQPSQVDEMRPGWYVVSMLATFRPELAGESQATYELRIDDEVFELRISDRQVTLGQALGDKPTLLVVSDLDSFLALLAGALPPEDALSRGLVTIVGDTNAFLEFVRLFQWPAGPARQPQ